MRLIRFFAFSFVTIFVGSICLSASASTQCNEPEVVQGADAYNNLVCNGYAALKNDDNQKALDLFLAASKQPVLESPNVRLFGNIAYLYAKLGHFQEADTYLQYDNISALWMIGIVRCKVRSGSTSEDLVQDGRRLSTVESTDMVDVLCGPVFDEFSYYRDRNAESFIPAAEAILRYESYRKKIDILKKEQTQKRK